MPSNNETYLKEAVTNIIKRLISKLEPKWKQTNLNIQTTETSIQKEENEETKQRLEEINS
jgi:hypothetical protein